MPDRPATWVAFAIFLTLCTACIVAIVALALVITPRTPPPQTPSRFGFPTVASPAWVHTSASRTQAADEAWGQAQVLSRITARKYRTLRVASPFIFASVVMYLVLAVTLAVVR